MEQASECEEIPLQFQLQGTQPQTGHTSRHVSHSHSSLTQSTFVPSSYSLAPPPSEGVSTLSRRGSQKRGSVKYYEEVVLAEPQGGRGCGHGHAHGGHAHSSRRRSSEILSVRSIEEDPNEIGIVLSPTSEEEMGMRGRRGERFGSRPFLGYVGGAGEERRDGYVANPQDYAANHWKRGRDRIINVCLFANDQAVIGLKC